MQIQITYTTELKDVPLEVGRMLHTSIEDLREQLNSLEEIGSKLKAEVLTDTRESLLTVEKTLKAVNKFDDRLKDSMAILNGYGNVLKGRSQQVSQNVENEEKKQTDVTNTDG